MKSDFFHLIHSMMDLFVFALLAGARLVETTLGLAACLVTPHSPEVATKKHLKT